MFCDAAGRPLYPAKVVKERVWDIIDDSALPSWLTSVGSSPVLTYDNPSTGRGRLRCQTKSSSPTSGDKAGIQTAFNVAAGQFEEISFVVYSVLSDGNSAGSNALVNLSYTNGSTTGFYLRNTTDGAGIPANFRAYPSAVKTAPVEISTAGNATNRKDLGIVIRPRSKEIFVCSGDPYEGGGVIYYDVGNFVSPSASPIEFSVQTLEAAQHYLEFSKVKLRLVHM